jgi:hypothetical protein
MAFKIKDLMINIAPSRTRDVTAGCVGGEKSDLGCVGGEKSDVGCVGGEKSDAGGAVGRNAVAGGCPGHRTDVVEGCTGHRTDIATCPGHRTDVVVCVGRNTDIAVCVGRQTQLGGCTGHRTDVETCPGHRTDQGGCAGVRTFHCGRCTLKSPRPDFSPACDPGDMLEELSIIKAQLQAELAQVDEEITEIEDTLQPKTLGEVEELQTKLQEALDELGKIKAQIEKK